MPGKPFVPSESSVRKGALPQAQAGFTLIELLVVTMIIGLMAPLISQVISQGLSAKERAYREEQTQTNKQIADAIIGWAGSAGMTTPFAGLAPGRLPPPPGGGWDITAGTANYLGLRSAIEAVVPNDQINTDGTQVGYRRAYQVLPAVGVEAFSARLWGSHGPEVALEYDVATLWLSTCDMANTEPACSGGRPGYSPVLSVNSAAEGYYRNYTFDLGDIGPVMLSTLPNQQRNLRVLANQVEAIRNRLLEAFRARATRVTGDQIAANHFLPWDKSALPTADPTLAASQNCAYAWIALDAGIGRIILGQLGFSEDRGRSPWGGTIEYCPDYNPDPAWTPADRNQAPHAAALRFNRIVTDGAPPGAPGNNVVVVF
ncbi:MAG: type II secretion system protein [Marinospirillum sp.]|uniref:type II secretion system protein n=1 Tax=Marinospirillum sp. TaxID=2183934 RepID=UPI0019E34346|nr:type II secretion system protein [Marinospirillum sp.]MBE0506262.1 type II secretion system protein [Marinospirillum sp.]